MNKLKNNKLNILGAFLFLFILPLSIAFTPAGQWVGNTVSGFLNPATEDLDMANNDIKMGTGLIGYDGTANEGWSFDTSGNITMGTGGAYLNLSNNNISMGTGLIGFDSTASEGLSFDTSGNVTLAATDGSLILPLNNDAATPTLAFGDGDTGIMEASVNELNFVIAGNVAFKLNASHLYVGGQASMRTSAASSTNPVFVPDVNNANTGIGWAVAGQLSHITDGRETMRMISSADTDSDTDDVLSTGVSGYHGLVLVRSITDNTSAIYRVSNVTVSDVSLDGDHTSTKDTGSKYNFYYDTDQFKLQNKVGDNKSVSVAFWVLPT